MKLPYVAAFTCNTAVGETTGFTPSCLVYGREVMTTLEVLLHHYDGQNDDDGAALISQGA